MIFIIWIMNTTMILNSKIQYPLWLIHLDIQVWIFYPKYLCWTGWIISFSRRGLERVPNEDIVYIKFSKYNLDSTRNVKIKTVMSKNNFKKTDLIKQRARSKTKRNPDWPRPDLD